MKKPWDFTEEEYKEAVRMSLEHHEDGAHRTKETYEDFKMGTEFCALCQMFDYGEECDMCPLADNGGGCTPEYFEAENAKDVNDFLAFHDAEVALCDRIRNLPDYYHWFAQKAKGMVRKFEGKKYRYTGDERAPKKGEVYQNPYYAVKLCTCGVKCSPLLRHILEPVDEGKSDTSVGAGISRSFDIRRDTYIPKYKQAFPNCLTCAHDYAPKQDKPKFAVGEHIWWDGTRRVADPEEAQEVKIISYDDEDDRLPYLIAGDDGEEYWATAKSLSPLPTKPTFKVGDIVALSVDSRSPCPLPSLRERRTDGYYNAGSCRQRTDDQTIYRLATDDEALAYWLKKATVTHNGVLVRAFKNRDGVTGVYWNDGGEKDWAWGKGLHKIIDPDLPVIPYKFNKGKYPYPEKGE